MRAVLFFLGTAAISAFSELPVPEDSAMTVVYIAGGLLILDVIEVFR